MMVHQITKAACLFAFLSFFSSCYYDVESELYPNQTLPDSCSTPDVTYVNGIQQLTQAQCASSTGCHAPGAGRVDLSTYAGVKSIADNGKMHQRVVVEKSMPPSGPLPPCELKLIQTWLDNGAPEN